MLRRYLGKILNEGVWTEHDEWVASGDYDALAAELTETRSDRHREHDLRVRYTGVTETQAERIRRLEAEVQTLREAIDAMETMPTGMSQAVCRAMAKYWNGLANRMAREGSPSDSCDLSTGPSLSDNSGPER